MRPKLLSCCSPASVKLSAEVCVWSVPYWHTVRAIERWMLGEYDDAGAETSLHAADTLEIGRYVSLSRSVLAIVEADR